MSQLSFSYDGTGWGLWKFWSMDCTGQLFIPQDGSFQFIGYADDGVRIWVDGNLLVDDWAISYATAVASPWVNLSQGLHSIRIVYVQGPPVASILKVNWRSNYFGEETIQATGFVPQPPQISMSFECDTWGDGGWCKSGGRITASATDPLGGSVSLSGSTGGGGTLACTGTGQCTASQALPEGSGTAQATATSLSGSTSASVAWKVDGTPPTFAPSVPAPDGQNGWFITQPNIQAGASDAVSGVAWVKYRDNGGAWQSLPVNLPDGTHTVEFQAADNAGNVAIASAVTVNVDTTAPMLTPSLLAPDGQNGWFVTEPQVNATGEDATSGLASLQCRVDGGAWQAPPVSVTGDGTHTVECQAQDNAGNTSSWSDTVRVDTTAPASAFQNPAEGATVWGVVTLQGISNDPASGPASVEVSTDGGASWHSATLVTSTSTWTAFWDTRSLPDGTYTLMARAVDQAGNQEHTAIVHVTVANAPPEVTLKPNEWVFWQKALARVKANLYIPIGRVRITITDTYKPGRVRVWEYQGEIQGEETFTIQWNARWYSEDGPAAFAGEYPVKVEVWDIYGRESVATGTVIVPSQPTATSTPTVTPTATPTLTPTPVSLFQATPPTATAIVLPSPTPTFTATPKPKSLPPESHPTVGWLFGAVSVLGLAFTLDPRPRALRELTQTLSRLLEVKHD